MLGRTLCVPHTHLPTSKSQMATRFLFIMCFSNNYLDLNKRFTFFCGGGVHYHFITRASSLNMFSGLIMSGRKNVRNTFGAHDCPKPSILPSNSRSNKDSRVKVVFLQNSMVSFTAFWHHYCKESELHPDSHPFVDKQGLAALMSLQAIRLCPHSCSLAFP